ncbi:MAG: AAA family ATPase [Candidatus Limivivens sp.]|nr:AAA family ATPase [Candidatus Limivivens sp.]
MKLEYFYVDGYKGLKKLSIQFKEQSSPAAIDFLIGANGSGKSSMLEALGLIFTRIMQDELPGFPFEIRYRMSGGQRVTIKPQPPGFRDQTGRRRKLLIEVEQEGGRRQYSSIPGEYLPDRIVSCCSGANHSMEDILIFSPKASLASDLYDLSVQKKEERDPGLEKEILNYYEQLETNPRVLSLDAVTSRMILPVLFAILPLDMQKKDGAEERAVYCRRRRMLLERLNRGLLPAAFSFRVNDERLEASASSPQMNILRQLMESVEKKEEADCWVRRSLSSERTEADGSLSPESKVIFLYTRFDPDEEDTYYHRGLQKFFDGNPFLLLSVLLTAYREGVIRDIQFSYRFPKEKGLYEMEALSDGELMWLARTGLILMAQKHCGENTLFLYDEPDVHFNDDWNKDFIKMIYELSQDTHHEFVIATHSTLILTDAMYEQLNLFDNHSGRKTEVRNLNISTFAAQRDEISKQIFGAAAIGTYASDSVRSMMQETDPEKMQENIEKLGPGYQRFRLYEQFYALSERGQD